jgi:hypothetical protein
MGILSLSWLTNIASASRWKCIRMGGVAGRGYGECGSQQRD